MRLVFRVIAIFLVAFCLTLPGSALDVRLSDEAIREAYFLGQRRDGSYARLFGKYTKFLPSPKTGPYISSITFFTPFVQVVHHSDQYIGSYSAQQAQIDYRSIGEETVQVFVEIQLTDSYGRLIPASANSLSSAPPVFVPRPHDFWKDFRVHIYNGNQQLAPAGFHGRANSNCGRRGPCILIGATLEFDLAASTFTSDTATIDVTPPEGDPVSVDFNLASLR